MTMQRYEINLNYARKAGFLTFGFGGAEEGRAEGLLLEAEAVLLGGGGAASAGGSSGSGGRDTELIT